MKIYRDGQEMPSIEVMQQYTVKIVISILVEQYLVYTVFNIAHPYCKLTRYLFHVLFGGP